MAKGKRSKGTTYTSKGERRNVKKSITKAMRRDYLKSPDRILNQTIAHLQGKNTAKSFKEGLGGHAKNK